MNVLNQTPGLYKYHQAKQACPFSNHAHPLALPPGRSVHATLERLEHLLVGRDVDMDSFSKPSKGLGRLAEYVVM